MASLRSMYSFAVPTTAKLLPLSSQSRQHCEHCPFFQWECPFFIFEKNGKILVSMAMNQRRTCSSMFKGFGAPKILTTAPVTCRQAKYACHLPVSQICLIWPQGQKCLRFTMLTKDAKLVQLTKEDLCWTGDGSLNSRKFCAPNLSLALLNLHVTRCYDCLIQTWMHAWKCSHSCAHESYSTILKSGLSK